MSSPTIDVLFLNEGQGQHSPVIANRPNDLKWFLCIGPLRDLPPKEQVIGQDRNISPGIDVGVDVVLKVTNDRALGLDIENIIRDYNWWNVRRTIIGLWKR